MTDNEPRQLLPETESHHNLSSKLGASRPLPPRSRGNKSATSLARSPVVESQDLPPGNSDAQDHDDNLHRSHDSEATAKSHDDDRAHLEASGTASPVRMAVQRAVSGSSIRSMRSNDATEDIPREEIEKALEGLNRDDLVVALGRAKVQMDEIEARLDQQVLENETLHDSAASLAEQLAQAEAQAQSLQSIVKQREERIDEIMADQERMEGEVYSTMQIIERLRKQLSESEKSRSDAEKRYLDQTATMDKERQYYQDAEALFKSQKATQATAYDKLLSGHNELLREHERVTNRLSSIKASSGLPDLDSPLNVPRDLASDPTSTSDTTQPDGVVGIDGSGSTFDTATTDSQRARIGPTKKATFAEERDIVALTEELATFQKSHSSLSETMATLQVELRDVRAENVALRDQNETFMDILQEKTFSGALLNESAMLRGIRRASLGRLRAQHGLDEPYDDGEYTTESESLGIDEEDDEDVRTGGASISSGTIPEEDEEEDDVDDVPDTPKAPPKQPKSSRRRRADSSIVAPATDLASELEQTTGAAAFASPDKSSRMKLSSQRIGAVSDSIDELQQEVRELREANQALTLYISKIIDRIISREGYEHVLAVESRGSIRGPRHKSSRARLAPSPNHKKAANNNDDKAGSRNVSGASNTSNGSAASSLGGGLFGFGASSSGGPPPASATRKSKRTSSIDWRNLPFLGGGSTSNSSNTAETNTNLRPLTLQSDNLLIPPREGSARKVRTSEEVEDEQDVAERERIRQELLTRGIQPPKHQLVQSPISPPSRRPQSMSAGPAGAGGFAAFFSRVVGGASSNVPLSPTGSQAPSTPGRSSDSGLERAISSTPAARDAERSRALQLSAGTGSASLTKLSGGPGIASRARQQRAETHQQTLDMAADTSSGYPFPNSLHSSSSNSRATSGNSSLAESSILETSVAGDESYYLPGTPVGDSPLTNLPPLPHETTGEEDPEAYKSPTTTPQTSQDQGWKRALRRISLLSGPSAETQDGDVAGESQRSPLATPTSLPSSIEKQEDK